MRAQVRVGLSADVRGSSGRVFGKGCAPASRRSVAVFLMLNPRARGCQFFARARTMSRTFGSQSRHRCDDLRRNSPRALPSVRRASGPGAETRTSPPTEIVRRPSMWTVFHVVIDHLFIGPARRRLMLRARFSALGSPRGAVHWAGHTSNAALQAIWGVIESAGGARAAGQIWLPLQSDDGGQTINTSHYGVFRMKRRNPPEGEGHCGPNYPAAPGDFRANAKIAFASATSDGPSALPTIPTETPLSISMAIADVPPMALPLCAAIGEPSSSAPTPQPSP